MKQKFPKNIHNQPLLSFPIDFKKIGQSLFVIGALIILLFRFTNFQLQSSQVKTIAAGLLILGLLSVTFSKEKVNDEQVNLMKLKAIKVVFFASIFIAAIYGLGINPIPQFNGLEIVISMFIVYQVSFHYQKK